MYNKTPTGLKLEIVFSSKIVIYLHFIHMQSMQSQRIANRQVPWSTIVKDQLFGVWAEHRIKLPECDDVLVRLDYIVKQGLRLKVAGAIPPGLQ